MLKSERPELMREKLDSVRPSIVRRFHLHYFETDDDTGIQVKKELKFYIRPGMYADGRIGEIFIDGDKQGGLIKGAMDAMATVMSIALQHGVPLQSLTAKLRGATFGPSGLTGDAEFRRCSSVFDLIAQYLDAKFPNGRLAGVPEPAVEP